MSETKIKQKRKKTGLNLLRSIIYIINDEVTPAGLMIISRFIDKQFVDPGINELLFVCFAPLLKIRHPFCVFVFFFN